MLFVVCFELLKIVVAIKIGIPPAGLYAVHLNKKKTFYHRMSVGAHDQHTIHNLKSEKQKKNYF